MSTPSSAPRPYWSVNSGKIPPGVVFGMTTRAMGNMKDPENRQAALQAAGLGGRPVYFLKQVHGTGILAAGDAAPAESAPEGDGLITKKKGVVLAVFVADCLPIFLWERSGAAAGVFHAGWRGIEKGMPREAVASFARLGFNWGDLHAQVGPHIGACCYRVGPETAEKFPPACLARKGSEIFLDLGHEAGAQIRKTGVGVSVAEQCTCCLGDQYFSFRREKTDLRMMAFTALV